MRADLPGSADLGLLQTGQCAHGSTLLPDGSVGPTHILQTYVFFFVGTEYFWGLNLELSFPGCAVLGKGLTLSGPSFLIGEMSLGLAPDRRKSDFHHWI